MPRLQVGSNQCAIVATRSTIENCRAEKTLFTFSALSTRADEAQAKEEEEEEGKEEAAEEAAIRVQLRRVPCSIFAFIQIAIQCYSFSFIQYASFRFVRFTLKLAR